MILWFFQGRSLLLRSDAAHSVCMLEQPLEHTSCDACRCIGRPAAAKHWVPGPTQSSLSTSPSQGSTALLLPRPCLCIRAPPAQGWCQLASAAGVTQSLGHSSYLCTLGHFTGCWFKLSVDTMYQCEGGGAGGGGRRKDQENRMSERNRAYWIEGWNRGMKGACVFIQEMQLSVLKQC